MINVRKIPERGPNASKRRCRCFRTSEAKSFGLGGSQAREARLLGFLTTRRHLGILFSLVLLTHLLEYIVFFVSCKVVWRNILDNSIGTIRISARFCKWWVYDHASQSPTGLHSRRSARPATPKLPSVVRNGSLGRKGQLLVLLPQSDWAEYRRDPGMGPNND